MNAPLSFADNWVRTHGHATGWERLESVWDHLAVDVSPIELDTAALIESGAGGRRACGEPPPCGRFEVVLVVAS